VGIGSTVPGQLLDITGSVNGIVKQRIINTNSGSVAYAVTSWINDSASGASILMNGSANATYGGTNSFNITNSITNASITLTVMVILRALSLGGKKQ